MKDIITQIIGYMATVIGTSLMLPQIIKSLKTKEVSDVFLIMLIFYFLNCLLWGIYGILINSIPLILCNGIALIISVFQIVLKLKYAEKK